MLKDKPIRELYVETNRVLGKAVDHGLKNNRPPAEMISKLRDDVFVFSVCKTHIELKELGSHLVDENGKVTSWQKFNQEAAAIHKKYDENYLQAEYIFATSSAEMAAKWSVAEKDGDRYNLQYRTAGDTRVRDSHAAMRGITLPVKDPFWDSYYPPNGWRCRCTAVQVMKDKYPVDNSTEAIKKADAATIVLDKNGRDRNDMFRFNPGKQKVIFPPNHPYRKVQEALGGVLNSLPSPKAKHIEERRQEYLKLKSDNQYEDIVFNEENGGLKATHVLHSFNNKTGHFEKEARDLLFKESNKVILQKEITPAGETAKDGVKIPDGYLNDMSFEIASISNKGKNAVKRALKHCADKKAEVAVIYFSQGELYSKERWEIGVKQYYGIYQFRFKEIIMLENNNIHKKSHH
jgi:SPP1 gp7 family putative phage head morphogenesis protein